MGGKKLPCVSFAPFTQYIPCNKKGFNKLNALQIFLYLYWKIFDLYPDISFLQ